MAGTKAEEAADKMKQLEEAGTKGAQTMTDGFMSVLDGSMSAGDALKTLLLEIANAQLQKGLMGIFEGAGAGSFMGFLGNLLGFASGGYTGDGGKLDPAGIVHKCEFVMSKAGTQRIGVSNLDRLHKTALQGYSGGGAVGVAKMARRASGGLPMSRAGAAGGASALGVTIDAPVTVNAAGGTPEQNSDLAKQVARETELSMRAVVCDEIGRQFRPGAMLNRNG